MKKIFAFILALMLIASMAVPAFAVTPSVGVPDVPDFSDIKFDIQFKIPDSVWDKWFDEHPINWKPTVKIELPEDFWDGIEFDFFDD